MHMIAHQAVRPYLQQISVAVVFQPLQILAVIIISPKDYLTIIATLRYMMRYPHRYCSRYSRHSFLFHFVSSLINRRCPYFFTFLARTAYESVIFLIKEHIAYLDQEIEKIRRQIADLIGQNPHLKRKKDLLDSIPGIGKATIPAILAELDDLEKFTHVRQMVAFIGLAPKETLSGSSIKGKPRLCKIGHARLRKALYMPALVSIQCNPVMIAFYNRLKEKGKNGKVIVCAIMRKLVHVIFGVLKSGKKYDPNYKPASA